MSLIVLIGAVVVFLILQPTFSPVDSPRVIEKREERQAQVIPPSSPSSPVEPVAVPAKQVTPVIENKPTKAVEKKEEPAGRKRPSFPSRPPEPVVVPQKQDVPVEKHVSARQPSIPTPEMVPQIQLPSA